MKKHQFTGVQITLIQRPTFGTRLRDITCQNIIEYKTTNSYYGDNPTPSTQLDKTTKNMYALSNKKDYALDTLRHMQGYMPSPCNFQLLPRVAAFVATPERDRA